MLEAGTSQEWAQPETGAQRIKGSSERFHGISKREKQCPGKGACHQEQAGKGLKTSACQRKRASPVSRLNPPRCYTALRRPAAGWLIRDDQKIEI